MVNLIQQGTREGYNYLYDNFSDALYGVIFNIVQDEEITNDLLQDSFVKIWKNISSYDSSKGRLYTWMLNICRNTALDALRSKGFKMRNKIQSWEDSVNEFKTTSESMNIDTIGLRKAVDLLKPEHREIIDILYFQGYTQMEASEVLNMPLGTVKTRIKIALREIKKIFVLLWICINL